MISNTGMHMGIFLTKITGIDPKFQITDGVSNINCRRTIFETEYTKASGTNIFAIGIFLKDQREITI